MSIIAYRDAERKTIAFSSDCTINDRHTRFYCENPYCDAHLYIRALNSIIKPHFSATPSNGHTDGCYTEKYYSFEKNKYDEPSFNLDEIFVKNMSAQDSQKKKSKTLSEEKTNHNSEILTIKTTAQLYKLCKNYCPNERYNGYLIGDILYDERNQKFIKNGIFGKHIVEGKFHRYNKKNMEIVLMYPIKLIEGNDRQYYIHLLFSDIKLFYIILKRVFNRRNLPIAVLGDFYNTDKYNDFAVNILNGRQIYWV